MKLLLTLSLLFCFVSCKTYIDNPKDVATLEYQDVKILQFPNYNLIESRKMIPAKAEKELFYPQQYDVQVPKNIKTWFYSGNVLYLEYDGGQIIAIDTDYKNSRNEAGKWNLLQDESEIRKYRYNYYNRNRNNYNYDAKLPRKTSTFLYTNGKTKILFYNIKNENFIEFSKVRSTYRYVN